MTNASTSSEPPSSNWRNACSKALRSKAGGIVVAVVLTALVASTLTVAITRAPSPRFDKLLWSLEGDRMVSLREPGMPDGHYRVPVGTRCRLYRFYPNVNVIQVEDGRLSYDTNVVLLDDCPANRKFTDPKAK